MAAEYLARFLVQRGTDQFVCRGDKLYERMTSTDLFAVQRDGVLYHATKNKLRDSDWLGCMDGSTAKRVSGSKVIPLLLPPPSLTPTVVKVNGTVYTPNTVMQVPAGSDLSFEVETNPEANKLTKSYTWIIRNGDGQFTSSHEARAVSYQVGTGGSENINCQIKATGAAVSPISTDLIQLFAIA